MRPERSATRGLRRIGARTAAIFMLAQQNGRFSLQKTIEHRRKIGESNKQTWALKLTPGMKLCPECGELKARETFRQRLNGYTASYCPACEAVIAKRYRKANPEAQRKIASDASLFVQHSLRRSDYDEMLAAQGGRCAICLSGDPGKKPRFFVDHCHETMEIRGLLCTSCNSGLGFLKENPKVLERAIAYLKTARTGKYSQCRRGRGQHGPGSRSREARAE